MDSYRLWCRVTIVHREDGGAGNAGGNLTLDLGGPGLASIQAVDTLARLALLARRAGATIHLSQVGPEMRELLELSGLGLDPDLGLPVEVCRQAESGEDQLAVEEAVESGDPPV